VGVTKIKVETPEAIEAGTFTLHLADCVILTQDNKILMQQRPKNWRTYPGALNIFGGHVEDGESIMQALTRELHEETGAQVNAEDVIFLGAISEEETNYSELVHVHFWHDKQGTITGCYEAEERRFDKVEEALAHPRIMDYARWALLQAKGRGFLI
jgi:8-oxo-dGTP diphosphatase